MNDHASKFLLRWLANLSCDLKINHRLLGEFQVRRCAMALDAIDHYLLGHAQQQHERWLQQNVFQTRDLQQQLAEQAAANQGHLAIVKALRAAYEKGDWATIQAILGNYETRTAIYQTAYFQTYNSMRPT
jgi:vacuolar-type H+-ATPase catalytic subunit A/Vma1